MSFFQFITGYPYSSILEPVAERQIRHTIFEDVTLGAPEILNLPFDFESDTSPIILVTEAASAVVCRPLSTTPNGRTQH